MTKKDTAETQAPILASDVRRILTYDRDTGAFTWLVTRGGTARQGSIAGHPHHLGYWEVTCLGATHKAHRLAWLYVYGKWPIDQIDHINGIRNDNRIANLRECSRAENYQNKSLYRNNTSGFTGVTWHEPNKAWLARIGVSGKKRCLGYHDTPQKAYDAYLCAKASMHSFQPIPRKI